MPTLDTDSLVHERQCGASGADTGASQQRQQQQQHQHQGSQRSRRLLLLPQSAVGHLAVAQRQLLGRLLRFARWLWYPRYTYKCTTSRRRGMPVGRSLSVGLFVSWWRAADWIRELVGGFFAGCCCQFATESERHSSCCPCA